MAAEWCASQYYPANPDDFSTWGLTDAEVRGGYAGAGVTLDPATMAHFVLDTSRNGQGPWTAPTGAYPDPEEWCNPPDRGVGALPTTDGHRPAHRRVPVDQGPRRVRRQVLPRHRRTARSRPAASRTRPPASGSSSRRAS